ncbi:hypothetical protein OSTOST_01328 [Ostertagia ostertagi]
MLEPQCNPGKGEKHEEKKTSTTTPTTLLAPTSTSSARMGLAPSYAIPTGVGRKLTPMPRDLHPPHHTKPIRYALFEPPNWIYDGCLTDAEFNEKVRFFCVENNYVV